MDADSPGDALIDLSRIAQVTRGVRHPRRRSLVTFVTGAAPVIREETSFD
jgi:hypothetical protein